MVVSQLEFAYLAGLLDGEGHIAVHHNLMKDAYYAVVHIANTDYRVVDWLSHRFDVRVYEKKASQKLNHRTGYLIHFRQYQMLEILEGVQPFIVIKEEQVCLTIKFLQIHRTNKRKVSLRLAKYVEFSEIYKQFQHLNTRGYQ